MLEIHNLSTEIGRTLVWRPHSICKVELVQNIRVPIQNIKVPIQHIRVPIQNIRVPIQNIRVPIQNIKVPIQNIRVPTPGLHNKIPALRILARGWVAQICLFSLAAAKTFQGLGPERPESSNGDRAYNYYYY